jgi:hypothetical protein
MKRIINSLVWLAGFGCAASACGLASATQTVYTSLPLPASDVTGQDMNGNNPSANATELASAQAVESQFLGALSAPYTQTYDSLTGTFTPSSTQTIPFGPVTGTAEFTFVAPAALEGLSVSGQNGLAEEPGASTGIDDIVFSSPINAFGSYFLNLGDHNANNNVPDTVTLRLENTLVPSSSDLTIGTLGLNASFGNVFYFGVTDTNPFNKITVLRSNSADGFVLDNTSIAPVPEPGTLVLCGIAGALLAAGSRLRRKAAARAIR